MTLPLVNICIMQELLVSCRVLLCIHYMVTLLLVIGVSMSFSVPTINVLLIFSKISRGMAVDIIINIVDVS